MMQELKIELTKKKNGQTAVSINDRELIDLEQQLISGDDTIELPPVRHAAKHDRNFYAKVALYTLAVMGAAAGATYLITRKLTNSPDVLSSEELCQSRSNHTTALDVLLGQTGSFNPMIAWVAANFTSLGAVLCYQLLCADMTRKTYGFDSPLAIALFRGDMAVPFMIDDQCLPLNRTTNSVGDNSARDCVLRGFNSIFNKAREICMFRLPGRTQAFERTQKVSDTNISVTELDLQLNK